MSTPTPNMGLLLPTIAVDSGLTWEQAVNTNSTTVDNHNHTPGNGALVPSNGISINGLGLSFNNLSAYALQATTFTQQTSLTTLNSLWVGTDGNLYFNDGASDPSIKITSGGAVNATSSGIASGSNTASFVSNVLVVNAASSTPANIQCASILLGNNASGSKYLTLSPPSALGANLSQTLPTTPAATSFMTMNSSGVMAASVATSGGITGSNIASATITGSNIASATIAGSNIASATITGSNIASSTIIGSNVASSTIGVSNMASAPNYGGGSSGTYYNNTSTYTTMGTVGLETYGNNFSERPILVALNGPMVVLTNLSSTATAYIGIFDLNVSTTVPFVLNELQVPSSATIYIPFSAFSWSGIYDAAISSANFAIQGKTSASWLTISTTLIDTSINVTQV